MRPKGVREGGRIKPYGFYAQDDRTFTPHPSVYPGNRIGEHQNVDLQCIHRKTKHASSQFASDGSADFSGSFAITYTFDFGTHVGVLGTWHTGPFSSFPSGAAVSIRLRPRALAR
jgi:hypothetical protein